MEVDMQGETTAKMESQQPAAAAAAAADTTSSEPSEMKSEQQQQQTTTPDQSDASDSQQQQQQSMSSAASTPPASRKRPLDAAAAAASVSSPSAPPSLRARASGRKGSGVWPAPHPSVLADRIDTSAIVPPAPEAPGGSRKKKKTGAPTADEVEDRRTAQLYVNHWLLLTANAAVGSVAISRAVDEEGDERAAAKVTDPDEALRMLLTRLRAKVDFQDDHGHSAVVRTKDSAAPARVRPCARQFSLHAVLDFPRSFDVHVCVLFLRLDGSIGSCSML